MNRPSHFINAACVLGALALSLPVYAFQSPQSQAFSVRVNSNTAPTALWRDRGDIGALDVMNGPGGKEHRPSGRFTFVEEDKKGGSPKFEVVDEQGVRWKAKLGQESQAETAATRLVWAAGYFADEDYYVPELRVEKLPKLGRGNEFVTANGVVHGVRLERSVAGQKKNGNWSWFKNPFAGTREFNGLCVMMALINNWDLKEVNNDIYVEAGDGERYTITDLGATFGRTGNTMRRSKGNLRDYSQSKFIHKVHPEHVDFVMKSRPFFLTVFDIPYYVQRTKMQGVVKRIPRTDAKWLGEDLGRLSHEQIRDCFRAAGYSTEEVEGYAKIVEGRIAELNRL